ncbi:acyl-CoA dehydrogenase [Pseudoduganella chitinolytica]|uniref:Acyl-CoA dehydrogenase n=1 Tax=Pseudoduganella chitinolytica TaxID=34070 RepID=A0ABY8BCN2_9BURK|nr:acyl-CoA dehydrogenase [Pseudoduganella chitinolytica]WEF33674.1 acyl-CoA dehydrogenase [Pseudoduganella chitinolytica]
MSFQLDAATCREADVAGWLTPAQQALIHAQDWLRMLAPRACGGAELPLPDAVRLEEAIAAQDGSTGWVVTLCAGAGWFAGFLAPSVARAILATPNVCLAGSGAPTGYADRDGDGWRIAGRWDIASGAPMATHFTLNAVLRERGEILRDDAGQPRIRAFVVPARDVTVEPTWRSIGLRASASHAYRIDGARVPADHGFAIDPACATAPGPLYRFPFMPLAFVTLGANLLGMARHFLALARPLLGTRRHPSGAAMLEVPAVAARLAAAEAALAAGRARFYLLLDDAWAAALADTVIDAATLQGTSLQLVEACRTAVDTVYPFCGLQAAHADSDINRVWRDFHTATQHALLLPVD